MSTLFSVTRRSRSDSVRLSVRHSKNRVDWCDPGEWRYLLKTLLRDSADLIINDTYGGDVREIVVLIMEVDKVVDEVTDMEIDK